MIFVTGASGFLGGRVVQTLCERGEEVTILARKSSDLSHLAGLNYNTVQADLSDPTLLAEALKPATQIIHCAACSTDWAPQATYTAANVTGTQNLVAAALQAPRLERLLHISTTDVYGYPIIPCDESHPIVDAGLPYNQTKGRGEQLVRDAQSKLPITILRPATIFGPRGKDFTLEIATLLRQRLMATIDKGAAPGGFTYVDNVVEAILTASSSPQTLGRTYNISDGTNATWRHYITHFAAQLKLPMPWIDLPFAAATQAARLFEIPHRLLHLGGRPLLTRHAVLLLGRNQEFPIARAIEDFAFNPAISFEEGIARSAAWVQSLPGSKK
ncbi:NAD-dependent epimerase/dehydratase family protein [Granulicella tundricola]|uniref:NAD-dependent epimerase/dehydratase n=1 Tax=Granulicella tundricola (strain ATCC BAA-1859 / DSM 23138 / MP5ACTX9) TaxID=1198114 RepID=E8X5K8_GRATM|nr:NAD-dependent epimerase/dehydratase family protein [Granulicella tundricola]ADW70635.1 NAD-dependent epimerase/dehydratase [Granulicella tundricola MP5ACTX9]